MGKVYGLSNEMINTITKRISYYKPIHKLERLRREGSQSISLNIDKTTSDILKESKGNWCISLCFSTSRWSDYCTR